MRRFPIHDTPPVNPINPTIATEPSVVNAAAVLAAGNIASRVLGLVRETVIAYLFGATGDVSIFRLSATLIQTLYDFLIGGMVSAALVPIFSDYASRDASHRAELWHIASLVINILALTLAIAVLVLEIFAPQLVWILGGGYDPALQSAAVEMVRLILPAIFFLGFWFVLQVLSASITWMTGLTEGVAYWAHIGGFIAGAILILPARAKLKKRGGGD